MAKSKAFPATSSIGTPLRPYAIAYRTVVYLIACGLFEIPSKSAVWTSIFLSNHSVGYGS